MACRKQLPFGDEGSVAICQVSHSKLVAQKSPAPNLSLVPPGLGAGCLSSGHQLSSATQAEEAKDRPLAHLGSCSRLLRGRLHLPPPSPATPAGTRGPSTPAAVSQAETPAVLSCRQEGTSHKPVWLEGAPSLRTSILARVLPALRRLPLGMLIWREKGTRDFFLFIRFGMG